MILGSRCRRAVVPAARAGRFPKLSTMLTMRCSLADRPPELSQSWSSSRCRAGWPPENRRTVAARCVSTCGPQACRRRVLFRYRDRPVSPRRSSYCDRALNWSPVPKVSLPRSLVLDLAGLTPPRCRHSLGDIRRSMPEVLLASFLFSRLTASHYRIIAVGSMLNYCISAFPLIRTDCRRDLAVCLAVMVRSCAVPLSSCCCWYCCAVWCCLAVLLRCCIAGLLSLLFTLLSWVRSVVDSRGALCSC